MPDWLTWLLDSSRFPARGAAWPDGLSTAVQVVELVSVFTCLALTYTLLWLHGARHDEAAGPRWTIPLLAAFVAAGAVLHFINFAQFYWPAERFLTAVASLAALTRLAAAVLLPMAFVQIANRPTIREMAQSHLEKLSLQEALSRERDVSRQLADQNDYLKRLESLMRGSTELARQTVDTAKATAVEKPGERGG